jgi:hypothetical protein
MREERKVVILNVLADGERGVDGGLEPFPMIFKKEDPLSRKTEGGGIFLEGERGERVHLGEERSEKRKMAYTVQCQVYTLNALSSLNLLNSGSILQ